MPLKPGADRNGDLFTMNFAPLAGGHGIYRKKPVDVIDFLNIILS